MMQLRRSARLFTATGALVLAASALTSCGFDYATDRVYTPGTGTNDRDAQVDVLGAVVVSHQDGSGTLITTFSNNDATKTDSVDAIESDDVTINDFAPIDLTPGGYVNLADAATPITVTGDFAQGDFMELTFTFGDGTSQTVDVPSVPDCYEYSGLDATADEATPDDECAPADSEVEH